MLKMGRIFQLQVTKYFLFRESLKFSDKDLGENERNFLSQSRPWERSLQQQNAGAPDNSSIFFSEWTLGAFLGYLPHPHSANLNDRSSYISTGFSGERKKSDGVITTWSQTKDHLELEKMPGTRAIIVRWTSSRNWRWHSKVTSMSGWEKCLGRIKRALCTDRLLAQQGLVVNFFAGLRHPEGLDCSWRKWLPASDDAVLVLHGLEPQPRSPQAT